MARPTSVSGNFDLDKRPVLLESLPRAKWAGLPVRRVTMVRIAAVENMSIPAQLNRRYLLHALFLTCFLGLCPIAHAQCALRVENGANPSNVRVILSKAAELTAELADDRQKAKAFEEIAHLLSATGDKGEAFQFYECAMKASTNVKMYEGSKADDMFFRIELITERAGRGDISGALAHIKDFPQLESQDWARFDVVHVLDMQGKFEVAEQVLSSISDSKRRDSAFADLAGYAAGEGRFVVADRAAHSVKDDIERIQVLAHLGLKLTNDGQRGRAITTFAEAVDIAKRLRSDDEGRGTGGAPQYWSHLFNSKDTMLGYIATQQLQAGLDSGAGDTLAMIEDKPAHAHVKYVLFNEREALAASASPATKQEKRPSADEKSTSLSPTEQAVELAESGDYTGAVSKVANLESYERPYAFSEIARVEVQRGDTAQALKFADSLAADERILALLEIAETLLDAKDR